LSSRTSSSDEYSMVPQEQRVCRNMVLQASEKGIGPEKIHMPDWKIA